METQNIEIKVTKAKTDDTSVSRTIAYVKVKCGPLWANFRLDKSAQGKFFLNPPSTYVESLKGRERAGGRPHTGFLEFAGLNSKTVQEVKAKALAELGLPEAA